MVILGAKITMPTHKPEVYWKLRSSAHQKDTPGCETTKAPHQPASKKCVSYFAQQKLRISFCDVDVTFLHSKITTSCKILILHLLHCKTSLVFGDVGLMSHFCVTFVVQNLWGYLGTPPSLQLEPPRSSHASASWSGTPPHTSRLDYPDDLPQPQL